MFVCDVCVHVCVCMCDVCVHVCVVCVCVRGSTFLLYDAYTLPHKHRHPITTSNHLQRRTKVALPLLLLVTLEGEEKGGEEKR